MNTQSYITLYPDADLIEFLGGSAPAGRHLSRGVYVDDETGGRWDAYVAEVEAQVAALDPDCDVRVDYDQITCTGATKRLASCSDAVTDDALSEICREAAEVALGMRAPSAAADSEVSS